MTSSTEVLSENARLQSFENDIQSPVPGSSTFDSRCVCKEINHFDDSQLSLK